MIEAQGSSPVITESTVSTSDAYLAVETINESRQAQRRARLSNIVCVPQQLIGPSVHVYRLVWALETVSCCERS
jgi:hypothetical protein